MLSVSRHLTVWRHGTTLSWRAHEGAYRQMHVTDLVDVAEQIVCAHEEAASPTRRRRLAPVSLAPGSGQPAQRPS